MTDPDLLLELRRIGDALERLAPKKAALIDFSNGSAFVWDADALTCRPATSLAAHELDILRSIDLQKTLLLENTRRFSDGYSANNALLWGARGMGKSSLVKAAFQSLQRENTALKLIEVHREDIGTLPELMNAIRDNPSCRFILFCDDLSFDAGETHYKSLKSILEGGIEGRPENAIFYATSNRRHLLPRDMMENERATAINPGEAIEEKVSLSDRFGLWIGFHNCDQDAYLDMIEGYVSAYDIPIDREMWQPHALEWSITRGSRSGRVAWQFVVDMAGAHNITIK
ncbi:MAG: ATP-binding protein [Pseudomonadota bacterium]